MMKTKLIIIAILIIGKFAAFTQNNFKNTLSGSVGLGTANGKYGLMTSLKYERFISNRISIGLGINQMSNHRFVKDSNFSIYFAENYYEELNQTDEDLTYNSFSSNIGLCYYILKKEKDQLGLSIGALTNLFQKRYIQFIAKDDSPLSAPSHVSIHSETRWEKINFKIGLDYNHFFTDNLGLKTGLFYSMVNGETFVVMAGFTTRF